ncbi:VP1 [Bercke-Baary Melophagus reo-like virus]|nr:VP1 [Bercke-Baary Melophagus reo-like virus]UJG27945.1 VP1 [Bercke-Baary Melophagus reo-like virus]
MTHGKIRRGFNERTAILKIQLQQQLRNIDIKNEEKQKQAKQTTSIKRSGEAALLYNHRRIQQRVVDEERVTQFYDLIDIKYVEICFNLCSKEAIITSDAIKDFSNIFPTIKTYPDLVLDMVTIFPDPPTVIKDAIDSNLLWKPSKELVYNAFVFDSVTNQVMDAKYRYLVNMDGNLIRNYLDDRTSVDFNMRINSELFLQLSNQSRWNTIWIQIAVTLFYTDTISEAIALTNLSINKNPNRRMGTDLITLQTIAYILKKWRFLPFTVRQDGKLDISYYRQNWTTCIIPLIYSLLELSKEEKGFNVNVDFLLPIIRYRIECAYTSFETETLDKKGVYSLLIKLITTNINKYARYVYDTSMQQQRLKYFDENKEVFATEDEIVNLMKIMKEKADVCFCDMLLKYISKLNSGTHSQNTELMRWLSGVLLIMGNAGIYYKTSLVLEKEKSVASQTIGTLNFPKPKTMWVFNDIKIDLETNWDSGDEVYSEISARYKLAITKYLKELNGNLQEWFYTLLTNKSQGFKVDIEKFSNNMNINQELLQDLKNVGQVRVASFLLDNEVFSVFPRYFETLQQNGVCTIRFQNNRRARIVEIVPNVDQIAYALILKIFEELKADVEDIAVGKQIGGVVDMSIQLRISGLDNGISIFSDVAAMDAHTQPNVSVMFLKMLSELIITENIGPNNYFPFKTTNCLVEERFDIMNQRLQGNYVEPINQNFQQKLIPSLAQTLLFVASQRLNKKYELKDSIFNCTIDINPTIFESGRFDTSAQHSTLLKFLSDIVYEQIAIHVPNVVGKYLYFKRKFGDDSYEALEVNAMNKTEKTNLLRYIVKATEKTLFQVGLKAKTELSAYYGDFLQQMAMCGVVLPKSARSSIYTDEKSALVNRDMIDLITNLANIITASAQRTYAPENVMSIVRNIWATNRTFRILSSKNVILKHKLRPYIKVYGAKTYLEYPYIMISLSPLNFPNQTFQFDNGLIMPASSSVRTVGTCKLNYIWNEVIPVSVRQQLLSADVSLIGDVKVVDPVELFIKSLEGTHIIESLLFFRYTRSQELSDTRYKRLSDPIIKMGKIAKEYFDSHKLNVSFSAALTLKNTYGITMPDSLLYYMKPIEQLKNMFEARRETADESIGLNDSYISFLNKVFTVMPKELADSIVNTCIFWNKSNEPIEQFSEECHELPIMPGYNYYSDYYRAQCYVGNAFKTAQRKNKALVSFTTRYGGSYNMEVIHRIGMKAKNAGGKNNTTAFYLFLDAMQLEPRIRTAVEQMFMNDDTVLLTDLYSSGFQPEQNFSISDSISCVRNYINFKNSLASSGREIMTVMLRDYLFLNANKDPSLKKYSPCLPPVTFVKFNLRNILSNIGVSTHG